MKGHVGERVDESAVAIPEENLVAPGDLIDGRYRLLDPIGVGANGTVFRARNEGTERLFAVKIMHPAAARDPIAVQRFLLEAKTAGRLRHPNVVEVYDLGRAAPSGRKRSAAVPYLVMEILTGESLAARLTREGRLPMNDVLTIGRALASGLAAAHVAGVVHRDLKPANVFLAGEERVPKILDFGISKLLDPAADAGLTSEGTMVGTPGFMAPEQVCAPDQIDDRTDVWALGAILYRAITGVLPVRPPKSASEWLAAATTRARPVAERAPGTPPAIATLVDSCLSLDRDDRPRAGAIVVAIDRYLAGDVDAPAAARSPRALVAALVVGALVATALMWSTRRGPSAPALPSVPAPSVTLAVAPPSSPMPSASLTPSPTPSPTPTGGGAHPPPRKTKSTKPLDSAPKKHSDPTRDPWL